MVVIQAARAGFIHGSRGPGVPGPRVREELPVEAIDQQAGILTARARGRT